MRIQFTRLLIIPVTTMFCSLAVAALSPSAGPVPSLSDPGETGVFSSGTDQVSDPAWLGVAEGSEPVTPAPLLLAKNEKVPICHVLPNGKYMTQELPTETAHKLAERHPDKWILGDCEDVISPH